MAQRQVQQDGEGATAAVQAQQAVRAGTGGHGDRESRPGRQELGAGGCWGLAGAEGSVVPGLGVCERQRGPEWLQGHGKGDGD